MTPDQQSPGKRQERASREWRWLLIASAIVLLLASLPTIYAWHLADAEHVFTGFVYNNEDGNSYIGKMRLGARGEWLFHIFYTPEAHESAFAFPLHLLLGKVAAVTHLSLVLVYHLARVALGALLMWTIYHFVAFFTPTVTTRRIAWVLIVLGSGSGWILMLLGASDWLGSLPTDFWVPEGYVFLVLYNLPHLALAESLLLWAILWLLRAGEFSIPRLSLPAGLAAFAATWIVPFYAIVLAMALGVYLIFCTIQRRAIPWRIVALSALVGAFASPAVLYNAWLFTSNPAFRIWSAQNRNLSPHPLHYLVGYVWFLIPAAWTAFRYIRSSSATPQAPSTRRAEWLPILWAAATLLLIYVPFVSQRRLIVLLPFALALPAACALGRWFDKHRWALVVYLTAASLSNIALVLGSLGPVSQRQLPVFRPATEVAAFNWLVANSEPEETILSSREVGNALPAFTNLDVFVGHSPETLYLAEKVAAVERFFAADTDDAWRRDLLDEFQIDYVFYGPAERRLGTWSPEHTDWMTPIYRQEEYAIYVSSQ
ncbi:MAG: hypothetical protein JXA93_00185 [Anaerolineae bacterium]|nr:hypothetical protein [Anaerolineae bacterium]